MQHNYNDDFKTEIAQAIADGDWGSLIRYRYDGDPGYICYVDDLDMHDRYLGDIPTEFLCFRNCNFSGTSFLGKQFFPQSFWGCNACRIDLRNTHGMLFAYKTDFRGAIFDQTTQFVVPNSDLPSAFKKCKFDSEFKEFLAKQGALFDFSSELSIETYGFGATRNELS